MHWELKTLKSLMKRYEMTDTQSPIFYMTLKNIYNTTLSGVISCIFEWDIYRSLVHIYNRTLTCVGKGWAVNWAIYSSTEYRMWRR